MATRLDLHAPDIGCDHCAHAITAALSPLPDVQSVEVDVPTKTVSLELVGNASLDDIKSTLADIGYPVAS